MNFLFIASAVFSMVIVSILIRGFFKFYKNKFLLKIVSYVSSISCLYFLIALSSLLWFFEILSFSQNDFLVLYSVVIFIQSLLLFRIVTMISKNNKLRYFLFFYFIAFVSFFYSWSMFFNALAITSFFLCFLFFIDLTFRSDLYDRIGYFGMFYSFFGILFYVLSFFEIGSLLLYSIFLGVIFSLLVYLLLRDLGVNPPIAERTINLRERPYFFKVLSHLVFIIVLTNLIFIGTIAVHEFGHFSVAQLSGCEAEKIVYEAGYFHTEVLCGDATKNIFVLLGGVLAPFVLAFFLFFFGGRFLRDVSILIVGFNLLAISRDLSELGVSNNFVFVSLFFGGLFLITGIIIIANSRVEEDIYLSIADKQ
jgi:hypothetical protein